MDQETLVTEKLDAGKAFVDELAKSMTVKVAFWLKLEADSRGISTSLPSRPATRRSAVSDPFLAGLFAQRAHSDG